MMRGYGYDGYGMMGGYSPWAGLLMLLFWLFIMAGIVVLVIWAVRHTMHNTTNQIPLSPGLPMPPQDEAKAIARKRLAAGEITREQFEEIRQALGC